MAASHHRRKEAWAVMGSAPQESDKNGLAIAAFVFGLASIPLAFLPYGVLVGPVAIVLGWLGHSRSSTESGRRRFARAGAILGAGGTLIWLTVYGLLALFAS